LPQNRNLHLHLYLHQYPSQKRHLKSQLLRSQFHVGKLRSGAVAEKEVEDDGIGGKEGAVDVSLIRRDQKVLSGARVQHLPWRPNHMVMWVFLSLRMPRKGPKTRLARLRKMMLKPMARRLHAYRPSAAIEVPPVG
jgi:hypothetical protein